jgi:multidrug efflux pump
MLYESLVHPITILSTLPSAGVGALLALLAARAPSSRIIALIGVILLIGIVEEERDHDDRLRASTRSATRRPRRRGGDPARPAVCGFRPIMMTTHGGAASARCRWRSASARARELRTPLGIAIVGGLLLSASC